VNIIWQSTINCQGGTIGIFTLMIPEIANQMVKISSTLKTCDISDFQYLSGFLDPLPMTIENWHGAILFVKMEIRRPSMM